MCVCVINLVLIFRIIWFWYAGIHRRTLHNSKGNIHIKPLKEVQQQLHDILFPLGHFPLSKTIDTFDDTHLPINIKYS